MSEGSLQVNSPPKKPISFETDQDFIDGFSYFFEIMKLHQTGVFVVSEQDQLEVLTFFQRILTLKIAKHHIKMIPEIKSIKDEIKDFKEIFHKELKEFKDNMHKELKEFKEIIQNELKELKQTTELKDLKVNIDEIKFENRRNRCRLLNSRLKPYETLVPLPDNTGKIPGHFPKTIQDVSTMKSQHLISILQSYGLNPTNDEQKNRILFFNFVLYG
jgi:hypothetical protein